MSRLVLSVDAGGVRSPIIASTILSRIEKNLNVDTVKHLFDVYTGSSGGSLVAASAAMGMGAEEIKFAVLDMGSRAFTRGLRQRLRTANGLLGPKYRKDGLMSVLEAQFGRTRITDIEIPVCIPVTDLKTNKAIVVKSQKKQDYPDLLYLKDVLYSSSAAPTYFPFHKDRYADGGLFAYSPGLVGYAESKFLWPEDDVIMLSIGSGYAESPASVPTRNPVAMIRKILEASLEGHARATEYISDKIPDLFLLRVDPFVSAGFDDTSPETIQNLITAAEKWFPAIDSFCQLLRR